MALLVGWRREELTTHLRCIESLFVLCALQRFHFVMNKTSTLDLKKTQENKVSHLDASLLFAQFTFRGFFSSAIKESSTPGREINEFNSQLKVW